MYDNLSIFEKRYEELEKLMADPEVTSDGKKFQELAIEHAELTDIVNAYRKYTETSKNLNDSKEMLNDKLDDDMRELVKEEVKELEEELNDLDQEIRQLLVPKDKNDDKNVIVEIRAGAGGDEAALFAGVLFRQYLRYAERNNWKTEILNTNEIGIGGYKEVIFMIRGKGAYSRLKFESGVHRVQRVPETEASGRIHTSTATVAVLPEVDEVEVEINPQDIRIDVFRSSGHGGQSVNTTDSAVRITHLPSGLVVSCQDEKSQLKNKEKAMKILVSKIYEMEQEKQNAELSEEKRAQVGTGDRSERIRTYNFPQGRITDHRINLTLYKLNDFVDGDLDEMIDALIQEDRTLKMEAAHLKE
ncbi:MAG: peptide chain release factor 1 [Tissierellia bacterium]|nr:peptide chain release factor 1 [Tissierellia bacterium]